MVPKRNESKWTPGFTTELGREPRLRAIPLRAATTLEEEICRVLKRFDLPAESRVVSCHEAGRTALGCVAAWRRREEGTGRSIPPLSRSPEIDRRQRRSKTGRLDVKKWENARQQPVKHE
jgi:hypothetical protein